MKYEFHVGDYVETKIGTIGCVSSALSDGNLRWTPTKLSNADICDDLYDIGSSYYIDLATFCDNRFKRIGYYNFNNDSNGSNKIKPLTKSWVLERGDGQGEYYFDSREIIKKINEIIEAVNRLEEKVNE